MFTHLVHTIEDAYQLALNLEISKKCLVDESLPSELGNNLSGSLIIRLNPTPPPLKGTSLRKRLSYVGDANNTVIFLISVLREIYSFRKLSDRIIRTMKLKRLCSS